LLPFCCPPSHLRHLPAEGELGEQLGHGWGSSAAIRTRQESIKSRAIHGGCAGEVRRQSKVLLVQCPWRSEALG